MIFLYGSISLNWTQHGISMIKVKFQIKSTLKVGSPLIFELHNKYYLIPKC